MRARLAVALSCILAFGTPGSSRAQEPTPRWDVHANAAIHLWYHGVALVGLSGPGPLAYYSDAYVRTVRADKRAFGVAATLLDRDAQSLRTAFARDSAFESLHFLPLYFPGDDPARLLAVVRAIAAGQGVSTMRSSSGDVAAVLAFRAVLTSPGQRAILARFATALEDEWNLYLRDALARRARDDSGRLGAVEAKCIAEVAPAIAPYLRTMGVRRGAIVLSPAIGLEGRVLRVGDESLVVVQWPASDTSSVVPLLSAVRELCFPLVERTVTMRAPERRVSRLASNDAASRAAVRCGALMLDARAPVLALQYRRLYLGASSDSGTVERRFDARFMLAPDADQTLRAEIARVMSGPRASRR